jgi:hypothetical protein
VHFTPGESGSSLFHSALTAAAAAHGDVFRGVTIPGRGKPFKAKLAETVVRFEARRAGSADRVAVARTLAGSLESHTRFGPEGEPLADALTEGSVELDVARGTGEVGWVPELRYRGETWRGARISELALRLREDFQLTTPAQEALSWVAENLLDGPVDLRGHTFAILGAGAELAPTPYLLQAGARVLWVDRRQPEAPPSAGERVTCAGADDLLADPVSVYRALRAEAGRAPLHLGLYAYAPGGGRELLLTAAMNAIASKMANEELKSLSMLVSPTTPGQLSDADVADQATRRAGANRWLRALTRVRMLSAGASHRDGDAEIARSIVALQGPTYLAAQYLAKMMVAEAWAVDRAPVRVSANVAGITRTKSLEHPLFLAGFIGAPSFGVEVYDPTQTRVLTTLMLLHDALNPDAPGADASGGPAAQAARVHAQAIHGGVRSLPWDFWSVIQNAAVLGLVKRPSVLLGR